MNPLTDNALLVNLSLSTWRARVLDKKASMEVEKAHGAAAGAVHAHKNLLAGCDAPLKLVHTAASSIRTYFYAQTLPWLDGDGTGWRILPSKNFMDFSEGFRHLHSEFDIAVGDFLPAYAQLRTHIQSLGTLFNPAEYPADVSHKFRCKIAVYPFPETQDFRVPDALPLDEAERLKTEWMSANAEAIALVRKEVWQRLHTVVAHMATTLSNPDAIFRDSLVENVVEQVHLAGKMNFTNDPDIDTVRTQVLEELGALPPQVYRINMLVRAEVASKAAVLAEKIAERCG